MTDATEEILGITPSEDLDVTTMSSDEVRRLLACGTTWTE